MTFLTALGGFPEMVLGLAFSLGCALLLAFVCLRSLLGFMARQQHRAPRVHNESRAVYSLARCCCCKPK
jgi:hypothetical protein